MYYFLNHHQWMGNRRTRGQKLLLVVPSVFWWIAGISVHLSPSMVYAQTIAPAANDTDTMVNTVTTSGGQQLNITGGRLSGDGANLFHSFSEFNLNSGQVANFESQPEIQNILNRVTGGNASVINGTLQVTGSNANLFLMNPAGIVFGQDARLNVPGSFMATTATGIGFGNQWFNAFGSNEYSDFVGEPSAFAFSLAEPGAIVNDGNLSLSPGENLSLLGGTVLNLGTLESPGGNITIAAVPGEKMIRISQDNHLLSLDIQNCTTDSCDPLSSAMPQGFHPLDLPSLLTGGNVQDATNVTILSDGTVRLTADGPRLPNESGVAIASGRVDVSNTTSNSGLQVGGNVAVLGDKVALVDAQINASGTNGGGSVLIGGDIQNRGRGLVSKPPVSKPRSPNPPVRVWSPNPYQTFVSGDSVIAADAGQQGNGGTVVVWANQSNRFFGEVTVRGGLNQGNGGFVEISSNRSLIFDGTVDLGATHGNPGTLLFDPENIIIVDAAAGEVAQDSELDDGEIFWDDGGMDAAFIISRGKLESIAGNIILEATNDITIEDLSSDILQLAIASGGSVTFRANSDGVDGGDFSMDRSDTLATAGGSVEIFGDLVTTGNVEVLATEGESGLISIQATGDIQTGNLSAISDLGDGGDISLISDGGAIATGFLLSRSNASDGIGGSITLSNRFATDQDITVDYINSPGGEVTVETSRYFLAEGVDPETNASVSTANGSDEGGSITIRFENGNDEPFVVGYARTDDDIDGDVDDDIDGDVDDDIDGDVDDDIDDDVDDDIDDDVDEVINHGTAGAITTGSEIIESGSFDGNHTENSQPGGSKIQLINPGSGNNGNGSSGSESSGGDRSNDQSDNDREPDDNDREADPDDSDSDDRSDNDREPDDNDREADPDDSDHDRDLADDREADPDDSDHDRDLADDREPDQSDSDNDSDRDLADDREPDQSDSDNDSDRDLADRREPESNQQDSEPDNSVADRADRDSAKNNEPNSDSDDDLSNDLNNDVDSELNDATVGDDDAIARANATENNTQNDDRVSQTESVAQNQQAIPSNPPLEGNPPPNPPFGREH
jgi:filamentous hemagglutinin family protein